MYSLLSEGLAGIQPVDISGIQNVSAEFPLICIGLAWIIDFLLDLQIDVTELIESHSSYLWMTNQILEQLDLESYYPVFRTTRSKHHEHENSVT